jgi:L-amino acid N-acyltransferase YncA
MSNGTDSTTTGLHTESAIYPLPGYPTVFSASGGSPITIRAMIPGDRDAVLEFFRRIPADERMYFSEDVASPEVVTHWAERLDYRRALPLLAVVGDTVVATATLHHDSSPGHEHIRAVRIVVDPSQRNRGLGRFLLKRLVDIAKREDHALEKVVLEVVADAGAAAQRAARAVGFVPVSDLSAYVRYYGGNPHDVILLEVPVHAPVFTERDEPAVHMF